MELKITDAGKAFVASPEFVASLVNFMKEWDGPHDEGAENVCRLICLGMCELDSERGPGLDAPEWERFITEHKAEIEEVSQPVVDMVFASVVRFIN